MDMTLPHLAPDLHYYDELASEELIEYRELARFVVLDAIRDIKKWNQRRPMRGPQFKKAQDSMRFLFSAKRKHVRAMWLSWLDMDDTVLQRLAAREGFKNMIAEVCGE